MSFDADLTNWWKECLQAVKHNPIAITKSYKFADAVFKVNFLQEKHDFFTQAVAHNEVKVTATTADFVIWVVDGSITKINPDFLQKYIHEINSSHYLQTEDATLFFHKFFHDNKLVLQLISLIDKTALIWYSEQSAIPEWERSFPFRQILHHYFSNSDYTMVHGAGVGVGNKGVLITAKGGSGKSTAALACLSNGWQYLADDFVLVNYRTLVMYSLYNVAKLEPHQLPLFPQLSSLITPNQDKTQKMQLFLYPNYQQYLPAFLYLQAIIIPKYNAQADTSSLSTGSSADALLKMAPSTIFLLKSDPASFSKLAKLSKSVPIYCLETSSNLATIPTVLKDLV